MALPTSGEISAALIVAELGKTPATQLGFGDSDARLLANVQSGAISADDFRGKTWIPPTYIGVSTAAVMTASILQTLPQIALTALPHPFELTSGVGEYMYFAAPVSLGFVKFFDRESLFIGGWDGAHNDYVTLGPIQLTLGSITYRVYRTDFPNLGYVPWEARLDTAPSY